MNNRILAIKNKIQKLLEENAEYRLNNNNLKLELEMLQSQKENIIGNKLEVNSQDFSSDEIQLLNSQLEKKQALLEESNDQIRELEEENLLKENTLEIQKNTINDLKEQNKLIKLAKEMSEESTDNHDLKIKINELIRDIDRCIDLLNE